MFRLLIPSLLVSAFSVGTVSAAEIGKPISDIELLTLEGRKINLHSFKGKSVVLVFLSFECPVSSSYASVLNDLAKTFADKNVAFLAVAPTQDERSDVAKQAKEFRLSFPVVHDADLKVARSLGAKTVPEVFVLDADAVLRYRGRIDDRYAERLVLKKNFTRNDLRETLEALGTGKQIEQSVTPAVGCPIFFPREKSEEGKIAFYRDVLPILQDHCQQCHRPGEAGPFSLVTFKQAVTWADDLKRFTQSRKMPPWKPTEGQAMRGERRMTEAEIATVAAWVAAGTPEGNPKDAKPAPKFTDGWMLGQPDLILQPSAEMTLGAAGPDIFRSFVLQTHLKEDKFVVAYEVRPGNRRVVHHTVHLLDNLAPGRSSRIKRRHARRNRMRRIEAQATARAWGRAFFHHRATWAAGHPVCSLIFLPIASAIIFPRIAIS